MKSKCFYPAVFIAVLALISQGLRAQISSYVFTPSSGTFTEITVAGGAVQPALTGGSADDGYFSDLPIGFDFLYDNHFYSTLSASTNGFIVLGYTLTTSYAANNLTANVARPVVAPLWDDLKINTAGAFSYQTEGTAPNRVFTAQWLMMQWRYLVTTPVISFQLKLYESNGKIEFIYRQEATAPGSTPTASIGITAVATGAGNFLSLDGTGTNPNASSVTETTSLSTKPATGQVYAFSPLSYAFDAGLTVFNEPASSVSPGSHDVKVTLRNFGTTTLNSATIGWTLDGTAGASFPWNGSLAQGANDGPLLLGNVALADGIHTLRAWTGNPNGQPDQNPQNDTLLKQIYACNPLSGIYTIGSTGADFPDFTTAVDRLVHCGISGPVTFRAASGTYAEHIVIPLINGVSAANTIVFESASGDSTSVVLTYAATGAADNWTVSLDNAQYVTFRHLTIAATGGDYSIAVDIKNGASYNTFSNNVIQSSVATATTSAGLYSGTTLEEYNLIENNLVLNGYYGIYIKGASSTSLERGNVIRGNHVKDFYYYGIYSYYEDAVQVISNKVENIASAGTVYGIYTAYCDNGIVVQKNMVNVTGATANYGIDIYYCDATSAAPGLISNNFVSQTSVITGTVYALYSATSTYQNFYNNSVNMLGTSASAGRAFYMTGGSDIRMVNNILVNAGGGYAIYVGTTSALVQSNFNDLFTTGTNVGYFTSARANLAAWQAATSMDANSVSADPAFLTSDYLLPTNFGLNSLGTPLTEVPDDILGVLRDPSSPDMGAIEFEPADSDAGILSIDEPANPALTGINNISVTIKNYGISDLNSVTVNWEVDGVAGLPFPWNGTIPSGGTLGPVNAGTVNLSDGSHTIRAWTTDPNGNADMNNVNDTAQKTVFACNPLSGVYTIGGTGADFATFAAAINRLTNCGVSGPVTFRVADGTYTEQVTLTEVFGVSAANPVIFESVSGDSTSVILTFASSGAGNNWTVLLDGADYITFRNMTIAATGGDFSRVVEMKNGANHNTFSHNVIQSSISTATTSAGFYSSTTPDDYNLIECNLVLNGYYGIYWRGESSSSLENGNIIRGNEVKDFYYYGVYPYYQNAVQVISNKVSNSAVSETVYGIYAGYCNNGSLIQKNMVNVSGSSSNYAIELYYCSGTATEPGLVSDNFACQTSLTTSTAYAIYSTTSNYQKIYANSAYITGTSTSSGRTFYLTSGGNISLVDNILVNAGGGYAIYINTTAALVQSDYNDFYTTGANLGYFTSAKADLAAWQTATGMDAHSVSMDPIYSNPANLVPSNFSLNGLGTPLPEVPDDIFGVLRDPSNPDMGAVEFTPAESDAGVFEISEPTNPATPGTNNISVAVKNYGLTDLVSVDIYWDVDGVTSAPFNWQGNVAPGAVSAPIIVGTANLNPGQHTITAWTADPNNSPDQYNANDTLHKTVNACYMLSGIYTIGGPGADFPSFAAALTPLISCGVSGPVTFRVADGTYNEQVTIPAINGVNATNTLTFESASGDSTLVTLTYAPTGTADNWTLALDDADYVTFRNMTISSTGGDFSRVVELRNGACHNTFSNNVIQSDVSTATSSAGFYSSTTQEDYNIMENNLVLKGYYGIYWRGPSATVLENGNIIRGNVVKDFYYYGIYPYQQNAVEVSSNTVENASTSGTVYGIYLGYCDNGILVQKNRVHVSGGTSNYGIYLNYCDGTTGSTGLVVNNFISETATGTGTNQGISINTTNYQNIYYNSVNILGTSTTAGRGLYITGGGNISLIDNILMNGGGGYAIYVNTTAALVQSDYNDFFSTGTNLGYYTSARANLAAWQAATGKDANSISHNPLYASATNLVPSNFAVNDHGTPLDEVSDDIFGNPRDPSTPDMGAAEFEASGISASLAEILAPASGCNLGAEPVTVLIINSGIVTINGGLTASYLLQGASQPVTEAVPNIIAPGDSLEFTFATPVNLASINDTTFFLTAYLDLAGDLYHMDDTASIIISSALRPADPAAVHTVNPADSTALLTLVSPAAGVTYSWFDVPSGGTPLGQGNTFLTPPLTGTTVYYVEGEKGSSGYAGPPNTSIGAGGNTNYTTYSEVFDVLAPGGITIESVDIYPAATGSSFTIVVETSAGTLVDTYSGTTTSASPAVQVVPVDFQVPAGTGYKMHYSVSTNSFRNTAGAVYPYTLPGVISITGNTFTGYPEYFYYFYHWMVSSASGCPSARTADTVRLGWSDVSGILSYDNTAHTGLSNSTVALEQKGTTVASAATATNGIYSFTSLSAGTYVVKASTTKPWGGGTAVDALAIMRHFVGMTPLTGLRLAAADVDNTHYVNAQDALSISKRFVGMISTFPSGNWCFEKPSLTVTGSGNINLDIKGLCFGDVNADYTVPAKNCYPVNNRDYLIGVTPGEILEIPVMLKDNAGIGAIALVLGYPESSVEVLGVRLKEDRDNLLYGAGHGELRISWYSLDPMETSGMEPFLYLKVRINDRTEIPANGIWFSLDAGSTEFAGADAGLLPNTGLVLPGLVMKQHMADPYQAQVYPNPSKGEATIRFSLPECATVSLDILNPLGEKIMMLIDRQTKDAGNYLVELNGNGLQAGIYSYRLRIDGAGGYAERSGKIILQK